MHGSEPTNIKRSAKFGVCFFRYCFHCSLILYSACVIFCPLALCAYVFDRYFQPCYIVNRYPALSLTFHHIGNLNESTHNVSDGLCICNTHRNLWAHTFRVDHARHIHIPIVLLRALEYRLCPFMSHINTKKKKKHQQQRHAGHTIAFVRPIS